MLAMLEDIVEGGWVGAHAKSVYGTTGIGTAYSPPTSQDDIGSSGRSSQREMNVETVLDVEHRVAVRPFMFETLVWVLTLALFIIGLANAMRERRYKESPDELDGEQSEGIVTSFLAVL